MTAGIGSNEEFFPGDFLGGFTGDFPEGLDPPDLALADDLLREIFFFMRARLPKRTV
jgi:hypothetical protein